MTKDYVRMENKEGITNGELIKLLREYPDDMRVVFGSHSEGIFMKVSTISDIKASNAPSGKYVVIEEERED